MELCAADTDELLNRVCTTLLTNVQPVQFDLQQMGQIKIILASISDVDNSSIHTDRSLSVIDLSDPARIVLQ